MASWNRSRTDMISDSQAKSLFWAVASLKTVFGPNRPVHVEGHLNEIQKMLDSWHDQKVMKLEMLAAKVDVLLP
jgi:uridine phosphorylase